MALCLVHSEGYRISKQGPTERDGTSRALEFFWGSAPWIGPLGQPDQCKQMAYLAVNYCMETLRDATKFFGVPLDLGAFSLRQERLAAACPELKPTFGPRPAETWE